MSLRKKLRVVFDTNVLISAAILGKSISAKAFRHGLEYFELVHSGSTYAELAEVLERPKFVKYLTELERETFLSLVAQASLPIEVQSTIADCEDPKDNKFLELAIDANATIVVSGDAHLLTMHPYRAVTILSPAAFVQLVVE
jgi:uncharacterized protein